MEQGLGSLEGAYLAQKQLKKEKAFKWDDSVLGVVDASGYVLSQKDAIEEQQVDIEFSQKNQIKEEDWTSAPVSQPASSLVQKVAHKNKKKEEEPVVPVIPENDSVQRSNIAQIASKFEEESREFEAQDKALFIQGMNGKMRLRHASDHYNEVAEKQKIEKENSAHILANLKKEKEETAKKLAALADKKKQEENKKKNDKVNKQIDEMRAEWTLFCQTLDFSHHDAAMTMW
jgi:hypothetical protein